MANRHRIQQLLRLLCRSLLRRALRLRVPTVVRRRLRRSLCVRRGRCMSVQVRHAERSASTSACRALRLRRGRSGRCARTRASQHALPPTPRHAAASGAAECCAGGRIEPSASVCAEQRRLGGLEPSGRWQLGATTSSQPEPGAAAAALCHCCRGCQCSCCRQCRQCRECSSRQRSSSLCSGCSLCAQQCSHLCSRPQRCSPV